ncbi:MAG TPA: hypothetical protein VGR98_16935 [Streptosporangiaceae bacterium]|nr:hypothetical protein [Streptosporangiaceae bacterium]
MPGVRGQGNNAGLVTPIRVDGVFDDPGEVRRLVERNAPYPTMASFLPDSAVRGRRAMAGEGVPPHFRATWAAGGRALADGAEVILRNPRLLGAASQLFGAEVIPTTVAVNVSAPMPAGAIHVDVPSFHGADRDRYPMQLLQAMAASGLFEEWRVAEAGAVFWSYQGRGGAYDYWPSGLDGPMCSEHPPFANSALVADNNRMYHRIGWIGDPAAAPPALSAAAQIRHQADGGWIISDAGTSRVRYEDRDIRISILWKARVRPGPGSASVAPLTPELITEIICADLTRRGIQAAGQVPSPADKSWLDLVHSAYYVPVAD